MSVAEIVRAWKNPAFLMSMSEERQTEVPENPAGDIQELDEEDIQEIDGGIAITAGGLNTCGTAMCVQSLGFTIPPATICGSLPAPGVGIVSGKKG